MDHVVIKNTSDEKIMQTKLAEYLITIHLVKEMESILAIGIIIRKGVLEWESYYKTPQETTERELDIDRLVSVVAKEMLNNIIDTQLRASHNVDRLWKYPLVITPK